MENLAWRKSVAIFNRLPELQRELRELRKEVAKLAGDSAAPEESNPKEPR
jgi:hypothetical protein